MGLGIRLVRSGADVIFSDHRPSCATSSERDHVVSADLFHWFSDCSKLGFVR